jgi:hypothetical protein
MLSPSPDRADQRRADRLKRAEAFLRDALHHLKVAGIDEMVIYTAIGRLAEDRSHG